MKEFTTIQELATAKTREEIIQWAAEMQKCPYDYEGEAFAEDVCKEGEDGEQCNECWRAALKNIKCKGEEKKNTRTKKVETPKKELAAKDSNAGVLALKDLCKTMTREEFPCDTLCPNMYGFPDTMNGCDGKHAIPNQCKDCWNVILDGVEWKEKNTETDQVTCKPQVSEDQESAKQELIAPTNDVKVLNYVDKLVEEVKKMQAQQNEWDEMLKLKIEEARAKVEDEKAKLQRAIDFNMAQIQTSFNQLKAKETKTQKSIKVISGQVVLKKASQKLECDKEKLLAYFKEKKLNDYIKVKEDVDWSAYKKTLAISNNNIVDNSTGETVVIEGLSIVDVAEKLEVK